MLPEPAGPNLTLQLLLATNATRILNKLYLDTNRHNRKYIHRYRLFSLQDEQTSQREFKK